MSKSNHKTIADLDINWTFSGHIVRKISDEIEKFNQANKSICDLKIKVGNYSFLIFEKSFDLTTSSIVLISEFMLWVNTYVYNRIDEKPIKLDRFELIGKDKFRIHVKE